MTSCRRQSLLLLVALLSSYSYTPGEAFSSPAVTAGRTTLIQHNNGSNVATVHHRASRSRSSRVTLQDALREGTKSRNTESTRRWHRRIFSKLLLNRRSKATQLGGMATDIMDDETEALLDSMATYNDSNREFIMNNFEVVNPEQVLAEVIQATTTTEAETDISLVEEQEANIAIDEEFFDVAITTPKVKQSHSKRSKNLSLPRLVAGLVESIVLKRIVKHSLELPEDLTVQVNPLSSTFSQLLLKGQLQADVELNTGRLVFAPIRFSKGKLQLEKVTLGLLGFLQNKEAMDSTTDRGIVRYPKQFDLHLEDLTISRHDLMFSPCIKNGLRRLLINILQDRGVQSESIRINSIDILPSGKIAAVGEARTHFGSVIPFEVRSGISFANRGHVLTFPGLEISLNRDIGLFVPVVPTIDLDVGHNARFRRINIDGKKKQIEIDASVTITPARTIRLMKQYVQSSEAFSSRFAVDVGRWLTELGRFSK